MQTNERGQQRNCEQLAVQNSMATLFHAFDGYDKYHAAPSIQLQTLVRAHLLVSTASGDPAYILNEPWPSNPDKDVYWKRYEPIMVAHRATTDKFTAESPHLPSGKFADARKILTVTNTHHRWASEKHDILITMDAAENVIPYYYKKGDDPIEPKPLTSFAPISELLTFIPQKDQYGVSIQIWEYSQRIYAYDLQAVFHGFGLSLQSLLLELRPKPQTTPRT